MFFTSEALHDVDDCISFSLEIFKDAKKFSIPGLG